MLKVFLAVMAFGTCFLGWRTYQWTEQTGVFLVTGVDVKGVRQLTDDDIQALAGIFNGQNIFKADIQGAAKRARANPWVKEVSIERRLPNRISMTIEERVPAVVVNTAEGRYLADDEGVVIGRLSRDGARRWQLPRIMIKGAKARPGEQVEGEEMAEALALVSEIVNRGGWRPTDVEIKAHTTASMKILYAGHEIRVGSGNYGDKLRRFGEIMADIRHRGLSFSYVDLRPERQAAVKVEKKGKWN